MKAFKTFIILCISICGSTLFSCDDRDCDEINANCPGVSPDAFEIMPYQGNELLTFLSASKTDTFQIRMTEFNATEGFSQWVCGPVGVAPGCQCDGICSADLITSGEVLLSPYMLADSTIRFTIREDLDEQPREPEFSRSFSYQFLGFESNISSPRDSATTDSTDVSLFLNDEFYPHILIQTKDTIGLVDDQQSIWRIYFSRELGVVGFETYPENKLYSLLRGGILNR